MSIEKYHYVGWFFECTPKTPKNPHYIFPDEDFVRIWDEGNCEAINNKHIFIPNKKMDNCFHLDRFSPTGIFEMNSVLGVMPSDYCKTAWLGEMKRAGDILNETYGLGNVCFKYGIIVYAN